MGNIKLIVLTLGVGILLASCAVANKQQLVPISPLPPANTPSAEHPEGGYCKMVFNVDEGGATYDVRVIKCTEEIYRRVSIKSVEKWKYNPKIVNGQAVKKIDVEAQVTFKFTD